MFEQLVAALTALQLPVTQYAWDVRPDTDNIVISLSNIDSTLQGDDQTVEQAPQGYIDYFSPSNTLDNMHAIQNVLNTFEGLAWYLNSVDYEENTRLMHWQWAFSLVSW